LSHVGRRGCTGLSHAGRSSGRWLEQTVEQLCAQPPILPEARAAFEMIARERAQSVSDIRAHVAAPSCYLISRNTRKPVTESGAPDCGRAVVGLQAEKLSV
jgi:hypothetical protein